MPPREWRQRALDMLEAVAKIQRYLQGMTYEVYLANEMLRDAVERNFIVLGEAANNMPDEIRSRDQRIPWAVMRAIRHRVAHEYYAINQFILWETAIYDLPPVRDRLQELLRSES